MAIKKHKEKISINNVYNEYKEYLKKSSQTFKLDILQIKKRLEELSNCNFVCILFSEKYNETYELKIPLSTLCEYMSIVEKECKGKQNPNLDMNTYEWFCSFK